MGEVLLSTSRLSRIESLAADLVRVGAGVTLAALDDALATGSRFYPPAPTFAGATIGGTVATNAAGAATFKYNTTRDWVQALTVVLPDGDVLDIERGSCRAHADGYFDLELAGRNVRVPVPRYRMPDVAKLSAGYFAHPSLDLVDLFIGSEGTLGIVTTATLRVLPVKPARCLALVPFPDRDRGLAFVDDLRRAAAAAWQSGGSRGIDVSAVEHLDRRSLGLLREDGVDRSTGVTLPSGAALVLLVTIELAPGTRAADAYEEIGRARDADAPDTPLVRFCALLARAGALDDVTMAVPGDEAAAARLVALREAVPAAVNARIGRAQRAVDPRIEKTAGDMLVPFEHAAGFLDRCEAILRDGGLDFAVWGHISDGNIHPNVLPRSFADVESGRAAMLALGREATRLAGTPLAEHGVGRNAVKQQLLRELYGDDGIEAMRAVKRAIDPSWKLAPGVLFMPDKGRP
jgi:D-lactate dehydrogenase (cytochrome)